MGTHANASGRQEQPDSSQEPPAKGTQAATRFAGMQNSRFHCGLIGKSSFRRAEFAFSLRVHSKVRCSNSWLALKIRIFAANLQ